MTKRGFLLKFKQSLSLLLSFVIQVQNIGYHDFKLLPVDNDKRYLQREPV